MKTNSPKCKTACDPEDHKPFSFPGRDKNYLAAGGSGALTGAAAGAEAPAQVLQAGAAEAQLSHAGAAQLVQPLPQGAAQAGAAPHPPHPLPQGAAQLGAAPHPPQLLPQGAAQLGAAQEGAQHLEVRARGARQHPRRPASASPATRTIANRAPNTNINLRTISNSSLDLGRSISCRAAPRRPKQGSLQHSPRFELVSTQTFQVEATASS